MAYGALYRNESYIIGAGDEGSIAVGPTAAVFGVGSDGFQGFFPVHGRRFEADSASVYVDMETKFTEKFSGALALRYETGRRFRSGAGLQAVGALRVQPGVCAARYLQHRLPQPDPRPVAHAQRRRHDRRLQRQPHSERHLSGRPPGGRGARRGAARTESSRKNFTLGVVWEPRDNVSVTLDYYRLDVSDRIGLISKTVDLATVDALTRRAIRTRNLLARGDPPRFPS